MKREYTVYRYVFVPGSVVRMGIFQYGIIILSSSSLIVTPNLSEKAERDLETNIR